MQRYGLTLVSGNTDAVVTLPEAKLHLRVTHSEEDALITALVAAARRQAEHELQRFLVAAIVDLTLDRFGGAIELPMGATGVTSITYWRDDALQTMPPAQYVVDVTRAPGRIALAEGFSWPVTDDRLAAVTVRYTAGWPNVAAVPEPIKQWIKLQVGALYRNREAFAQGVSVAELPNMFTDALLQPFRILTV